MGPVERHKINDVRCCDSHFAPASRRRTANALPRPCAELVKSMHDIRCTTICTYESIASVGETGVNFQSGSRVLKKVV